MDEPLEITFDAVARRYLARRGAVQVAFIEADPIGADAILLKHTEVLRAEEGRGYGSAIVRHVLEVARSEGRKVIPVCPYAAAYLRKHPEYRDVLKPGYPI